MLEPGRIQTLGHENFHAVTFDGWSLDVNAADLGGDIVRGSAEFQPHAAVY